jgi:hypothetical protein
MHTSQKREKSNERNKNKTRKGINEKVCESQLRKI